MWRKLSKRWKGKAGADSPPHEVGATSKRRQSPIEKQEHNAQDPPQRSGTTGGKIFALMQEQNDNAQTLLSETTDIQSQLQHYKDFLHERKTKHEELNLDIIRLLVYNQSIAQKITSEFDKVEEFQMEGETIQDYMTEVYMERKDNEGIASVTVAAIGEHDESYSALDEWNKKCKNQMPNANTIRCSQKVLRETTVALLMVSREKAESAGESLNLSQPSLSIIDKLDKIREQTPLSLSCLQIMPENTKKILKKGLLYAVQKQDDGRTRSAKVTVEDNKTYLHCLQDGEPPPHAQTVEQSEMIGTLDSDSVMAFMDLSWEESIQGRIHILISPETPLGRNFRLLCTGDLGPSYARSKFFQVQNKGDTAYESVKGGDYEHNDGTGGASLVEGIDVKDQIYRYRYEAGIVWAIYDGIHKHKGSQFSIATGISRRPNVKANSVFGHVKEGLSVVRAAVTLGDINNVTIADCGVVLPL